MFDSRFLITKNIFIEQKYNYANERVWDRIKELPVYSNSYVKNESYHLKDREKTNQIYQMKNINSVFGIVNASNLYHIYKSLTKLFYIFIMSTSKMIIM